MPFILRVIFPPSPVYFCALDATRAEEDVLKAALLAAEKAGANAVYLSDDAGEMLPDASRTAFYANRRRLMEAAYHAMEGVYAELAKESKGTEQ